MNMTNGRTAFETIRHRVQFCVVGGGMAGMCAAIAAARRGVKTLLMHDRPVFGGNASSEVRMWVRGAKQPDCRETGIIEEIRLENLRRNTYPSYSVWDSILYEKVRFQENLTSLLNCSCMDAEMDGSRIRAVKGWQSTTQTFHLVEADYFADCSGDSILAPLTGADFRIGREARTEFGETLAVEEADKRTMGMSCLIQARETDSPKKFIPSGMGEEIPYRRQYVQSLSSVDRREQFLVAGTGRGGGLHPGFRDDPRRVACGGVRSVGSHQESRRSPRGKLGAGLGRISAG